MVTLLRFFLSCALCLWVAGAVPPGAMADRLPPERPEAELRALLRDAIAAKAKKVRIPPGTYRLTADTSTRTHILFDGVQDLEIDGRGVHLIMTQPQYTLVFFKNCSRMRVRGITVDCDPLLFTQGTVAAMDPAGGWYDIRIEAGYRTDAENFQKTRPMAIFHAKTREYKSGVADLFLGGLEKRDEGMWRVYPVKEVIGRHRFPTDVVQVGDLAAIPLSGGPAWTCRGCVDMVFEEITIYHSGNMAFHEHGGGGNTTLRRCRVLRKPGTTRLLSTTADGFHCKEMRRGPTVEGCVFEGMHDDGINIHGMFSRVLQEPRGTELLTAPVYEEYARKGDQVEFFREATGESLGVFTVQETVRVQDADLIARAKQYHRSGYGFVYRMKLDREPPVRAGDRMASMNYVGSGYVIRNNVFRNHRYRAILARGSNGLIENNTIYGCSNDAICLTPCFEDREGGMCRNVVIRGNTIRFTGMVPWHNAAIHLGVKGPQWKPLPCREIRNITIEGNTIEDVGAGGIRLAEAADVRVRDNRLVKIGARRTRRADLPAIELLNCERVDVSGNSIEGTGAASARIVVDPSADEKTVTVGRNRILPAPGEQAAP